MRRELFRLAEVEIELAAVVGKDTGPVLLTDLQEGMLKTVVRYPAFREGLTAVPADLWQDVELDEFAGRPRRRIKDSEFMLSADEFVEGERKKLKATAIAVFQRSESGMDADYANHLKAKGTLKTEMTAEDWENLILKCFRWQRDLAENAADSLVPMVTSAELDTYIAAVKADHDSGGQPSKSKAGRALNSHWNAIFSEAFRRLAARGEPLEDGDIQDFTKELRAWAFEKLGKTVPAENTVAGRLREVLTGGTFVFDKSNN